jgi:hypothetical protein
MKARRRLSSGDLLLLELVFAIIFFCLAMAATMSVFGKAYEMSDLAKGQDLAVVETNAVAEIIRASKSSDEADKLLKASGLESVGKGEYSKTYGDGKYVMSILTSETDGMYTAQMHCVKQGAGADEPGVYDISIDHYMRGEAGDGR